MNPKHSTILNVIEIFASIQGETSLTGHPTAFIRLAACNLRCTWCDTPYSFGKGSPYTLQDILDNVDAFSCKHVCVTGGEPLLQKNVYPLLSDLCEKKYVVSLETGGSLATNQVDPRVHIILDVKCPGSGMDSKNYWPNLACLREHDEVKFVINDRKDYDFAIDVCDAYQLFKRSLPVLFSPVFNVLDPKVLIGWVLQDHLFVRLNLQMHKYIWSPTTQGV
jgi:7-carboxy-7-deazaguanine synthase